MASAAKIAANRRNAQKSTGPRSTAGKARARHNALRHGLAISIGQQIANAPHVETLARRLAENTRGHDLEARWAAEAEFEMLRARQAKLDLLRRAGSNITLTNGWSVNERHAFGFENVAATLLKLDRYERRARSRRNRALRALTANPKTTAIGRIRRQRNRFDRPAVKLNIEAVVKAALAMAPQQEHSDRTLGINLDWRDCGLISASACIRLRPDGTGLMQTHLIPSDLPPIVQDFALAKISTSVGGGRWAAVCPETNRRVADLYWLPANDAIKSRHGLKLRYETQARRRPVEKALPEESEDNWPQPELREDEAACATVSPAAADQTISMPAAALSDARGRHGAPAKLKGKARRPQKPQGPKNSRPGGADRDQQKRHRSNSAPGNGSRIDTTNGERDVTLSKLIFADDFKTAESLLTKGELAGASLLYRRLLELYRTKLAADQNNVEFQHFINLAVHGLGRVAFSFVLAHDGSSALALVDQALAEKPWLWLYAVRAHAFMVLANVTAARMIYQQHRGERWDEATTWEDIVRDGFARLRKAGRNYTLMEFIEKEFGSNRY